MRDIPPSQLVANPKNPTSIPTPNHTPNPTSNPTSNPTPNSTPNTISKETAMVKTQCVDGRQADLTDCVEDPIRISGLIQSHGAMIVIKEPELTILQVSANTELHFGFEPGELLNRPLAHLLGETEVEY